MTERQARIAAGVRAFWEAGPGSAQTDIDEYEFADVLRARFAAGIDAADAVGRERVSEATVTHIVGLLKPWAEFFAPYVHDDNEWYRNGYIDGKDAGSIGEACAEAIALLTAQPEPGTHDDAGQPATEGE